MPGKQSVDCRLQCDFAVKGMTMILGKISRESFHRLGRGHWSYWSFSQNLYCKQPVCDALRKETLKFSEL